MCRGVPGAAVGSPALPRVSIPIASGGPGPWALVSSKMPPRLSNRFSLPLRAGVFSIQKRVAPELSIRKKDLGDRSA